MSLTKKKSRPIKVDDTDFRYVVSTSLVDDDWNFNLNVTIQIADGKGATLSIKGLVTRDFWLGFSDPSRSKDNYPVILPNHVEKFIEKGIEVGWDPKSKGSRFSLELDNKSIFK